ncbi:MAG: trehalose-phosphatase [Gemmatimonadota bacterium]
MSAARGAATPASPFDDLDSIRARLSGGPVLVALDFDGTLTEIVDDPAAPGITAERRSFLATIPAPGRRLTIVSGRKLEDVRRRVGIPGVIYIGNHGLEIEGPAVERRPPPEVADRLARLLGRIDRLLEDEAIEIQIEIEDKTWTATLHIRPRGDSERQKAIADAIGEPVDEAGFVLRPGKASWEIRPAGGFDKGDALRWLIDAVPGGSAARSLYVGDDVTDEDAFRALPDGITVRVGDPDQETAARYRLVDPAAVYRLLEEVFG